MSQVVIENPILNSPFVEPTRHFKFSDEGITNEVVEARRVSSYFIPIPKPKKQGKQLALSTEWTQDRIQENTFINQVRAKVGIWRQGDHLGITKTSRQLLDYWRNPEREKPLFFCQVEALETAIYITEVASKYGDAWIENSLRRANEEANPLLYRIALKMATGSGKTVVMAMIIAWQTLNKLANPQDSRFSDTFLIVTPGITIRDRLRVLLPNDPGNYYRERDLLPVELQPELQKAKIIITNFHAFKLREHTEAGKLTKSILNKGEPSAFTETPAQMVRRVCREMGNKKNIVVINDEAHHCYRRKPDGEDEKLTGEERKEAEKREEEARIWISGLEAVKAKLGVKAVYDLSATPFFLRGSGYNEGTLFPWVVSDFSLTDAIECGIVKVPRVPVADDQMRGDQPTYRELWARIRDHLPKKGRGTKDESSVSPEPKLPAELEGALHSLYSNYEKYYRTWEVGADARANGRTPPVFIVVCNNTNVSKLVYDYVAGWSKNFPDGSTVVVPGQLDFFSNEENGAWRVRPNTILIDSEQLESGEAMSPEFKKLAAGEIEEFKAEYRIRFPGRDAEGLTDEDLLREVMNTVGKSGKLGEHVKCVVSVSMLTEGWDANTVTHILGVRAFGTQLLCEQVVGRGLRRRSYVPNVQGMFEPEYAEVYGVPFSFIPCSGSAPEPKIGPTPTRVRALEERIACEITFPRLVGYRYELPKEQLTATFSQESKLALSTADIPTRTENAPIVGESSIHTLDGLKRRREQEVAFLLAKLTLEKYFRDDDGNAKQWLFPQLLVISKRWLAECVILKDNTFPQLLLLIENAHDAADRIYEAIVASYEGDKKLKPILRPYDSVGSTEGPPESPPDVGGIKGGQLALFADFNGIAFQDMVEFYRHEQNWSNRMVLGDSLLVMTSLAEKEGLKGKVQTIYIDPPYGIKFGSNWQVSTRKRDVKDGKAEDATRQPEQIRAFRDTWKLGIHSYLSYVRDRLVVARDLLTETGSVFVQIGDANVHLVRSLLDEVYGSENCCGVIAFKKTAGGTSDFLGGTFDFILWYAKTIEQAKFRQLFRDKTFGGEGAGNYTQAELSDMSRRPLTKEEREDLSRLPNGARVFAYDNLTSQSIGREKGEGAASWFPVEFEGKVFRPSMQVRWKTNEAGMARLCNARRLGTTGTTLWYVRYLADFPAFPINNFWENTASSFMSDKVYVVQTATKIIERCLLMTTDPGDLVLDPTCVRKGTRVWVVEAPPCPPARGGIIALCLPVAPSPLTGRVGEGENSSQ